MVGGVYCPLSPRDPRHRLYALVEQTQSHLVLVHHLTKTKFNDGIMSNNIDSILTDNDVSNDFGVNRLSDMAVTADSIAYTVFTSGSTGISKAVC